ncbi:SPOR domain-containing protein [Muricoccus vinaceus]|uniref:SPOR domain-containing protein n=1 Tax=Muricoccus vinaceus TaxID=424704 RepID=A0ABV6IKI4_9PROT
MSDLTVPSYRVRPQRVGFQIPWRVVAIAGAVLGAGAVGGAVVWGVSRAVNSTVPTIEADTRPIRVKPSDPGGMRVANQDERIFESQRRGQGGGAVQPRLSPEPERPDVAALRQAAARQPPAPPVSSAPAAAGPAAPVAEPVRPPLLNPSLGPQAAARIADPSAAALAPQPPAAILAPEPVPAQPAAPSAPPGAPAAATPQGEQVPAITPPPLPANAAALRTGRTVVQLGAVASEEAARAEWARLQGRLPELAGRQPQITRVDRGDLPPLWRIRATNMPDVAVARALCATAKTRNIPCAVIGG